MTPLEKIIKSLDESIASMGNGHVKDAVKLCKELAEVYLDFEMKCIMRAYNDGITDYKCADDLSPENYFNKTYKTPKVNEEN